MKSIYRIAGFSLLICLSSSLFGQSTKEINGPNYSSGTHFYYHDGIIVGAASANVQYYNTADINYTASQKINLKPGFSVHSLTGNGNFHANISDFYLIDGQEIGQYEKFEIAILVPDVVNEAVDNFFDASSTTGLKLNPYDPEQVSIEVEFTNPNGTSTSLVYGFYYREYERTYDATDYTTNHDIPSGWNENENVGNWRVRFAPKELGTWQFDIKIKYKDENDNIITVNDVLANSQEEWFTCIGSGNPGFLSFGSNNRFLEYEDGTPFFAIGTCLFGPNDTWGNNGPRGDISAGEIYFFEEYIKNLSDVGNNYMRFNMMPDNWNIEWEELGNYDQRQNRMWELDRVMEIAKEKGIYFLLNLECFSGWKTDISDTDNDPNLDNLFDWDKNPYNNANVSVPEDFFEQNIYDAPINQEELVHYKNKLRYILSRWGYASNIHAFEIFNEFPGCDGVYTDASQNLITDLASKPIHNKMRNWHYNIYDYIKSIDVNKRSITTSFHVPDLCTTTGSLGNIDSKMDFGELHLYSFDRNDNLNYFWNTINKKQAVYQFPIIGGELGAGHKTDVERFSDLSVHNSIWSSSFSGGFGTSLEFWVEQTIDVDMYLNDDFATWPSWYGTNDLHDYSNNYLPLSKFFDKVLGTNSGDHSFKLNLGEFIPQRFPEPISGICQDLWDVNCQDSIFNLPYGNTESPYIESFTLISNNKEQMFGWVHNRSSWWGNLNEVGQGNFGTDLASEINIHGSNALGQVVDDDATGTVLDLTSTTDRTFSIRGVQENTIYTVYFYDTRLLDSSNNLIEHDPDYDPNTEREFASDVNGQLDIIAPKFGHDGTTEYPHDYAYVIKKKTISRAIHSSNTDDSNEKLELSIYPNPTKGVFKVENTSLKEDLVMQVEVLNVLGASILKQESVGNNASIDISNQPKGVYIINTTIGDQIFINKIVYQ